MSHEIRTPLNGMLGLVQLLNRKQFTKEEKHHLDLIQSSGEMLLDILNDVLDMSKIEAHELRLEIISFDVEKLLLTTTDFYKNVASEKGLIVNYRSDLPEGLYLNGDPTKIRQVLSNILANSVKFTEVGSINVSAECEIISEAEKGDVCYLHIRLTDTGIGMDADGLSHLFEKFTQADSSISRKYGGTGLGMAIVKELCELMNGTIEVDSVYGEGTSFKINFPMMMSSDEEIQNLQEPREQEMIESFQSLEVLVAEDNMVNAVVARGFLENLGINVRVAHDGAEAVRMFDQQQPDLILMDVNMPIKDGIQATREIRQKENGQTLPILALTADAFTETREKCIEAGMNGTVPKPFSFDLLRNTIYDIVKHKD
ncbi:MAG: response regulator [Terasakiella sp.]|uniref:response regulator n=1 Tax=unclassified Terasakiella TaxID=2614952 RepID=UPI003B00BF4F